MHPTGLSFKLAPYHSKNNNTTPPIQTDETAIVLFVFAQYQITSRRQTVARLLRHIAKPMANFLAGFIDHQQTTTAKP
jgi:GH15 family glucan-1,4-alpha-glucosidase